VKLGGAANLRPTKQAVVTSFAWQGAPTTANGSHLYRSAHERAYARCCSETTRGRCVSVNPGVLGNRSLEQATPLTHEEALSACTARGLRLCSSQELRHWCAGAGYGLDWARVWTRDSCTVTECRLSDSACSASARHVDHEAESGLLHELLLLQGGSAHAITRASTSPTPIAIAAARAHASCTCHAEWPALARAGCLPAPGDGRSCAVGCRLVYPPWSAILARGTAHRAPLSEHGSRSVLLDIACNTFDALARLDEMHAGAALWQSARSGGDQSWLSVGRQRDAWQQLALALEKGQPVNVIALGASMLAGWGCRDEHFLEQGNPRCAYPNRFVGLLQ